MDLPRYLRDPLAPGCVADCRGCAHRSWPLPQSLNQKQQWLSHALAPWQQQLQPIVSPAEAQRWHYRHKVCLATQWQGQQWQTGMWSRQQFIPIADCPVHAPEVNHALAVLCQHLPRQWPLAYLLASGQQWVCVVKATQLPVLHLPKEVVQQLLELGVESLWLHANPAVGKKILHKHHWQRVWGPDYSCSTEGLLYGPRSFQQLIPELWQQAFAQAQAFLQPDTQSKVLDLYSGVGSSLQAWCQQGANVLGVEGSREAVACARKNAPDAEILLGYCGTRLPQIQAWWQQHAQPGLIYLNPPRQGIEPEVLQWITRIAKPHRLAYLSCSAGTLARDLEQLTAGGYKVVTLQPYDFFPQTHHCEVLALLHHQDNLG